MTIAELLGEAFDKKIDKAFDEIRNEFTRKENKIKHLKEDIEKLKDPYFKDKELENMTSKLNKAHADLWRGFPISEDDKKRIDEWKKKHEEEAHGLKTLEDRIDAQGCCGGVYEYRFIPTSIGVIGEIICGRCGAKFTFQELS